MRRLDDERQRLIRSLAALDEQFDAGTIEETEYRSTREAGKARLLALTAGAAPEPR